MKKTLLVLTLAYATSIATLNGQVTSGLVAKYSFNNGNANDEVGTNNGSINGAILTTDRFGNANHAFEFDGIDDFLDLGSSSTIKPAIGSVSLWAKMTAVSNTGGGYFYNPIFLSKNSSLSSYFEGCGIYVTMNQKKVLAITTDPVTFNEVYFFSAQPIDTGAWYHFVITYDDDSLSLFINGQLENRVLKGFASTFSASEKVYVAKSGNSVNNRYFNGTIDDIRIYNRVLNQLEIDSLFNEPNPLTTGVNNIFTTNNSVTVYPNPTNGQISFSAYTNIQLTNITGQVIADRKNVNTLDLSEQPAGIYFLTLTDNKGQLVQRSKILKE